MSNTSIPKPRSKISAHAAKKIEKAAKAKSLPSIFVSIASYRDPECQHTVRDLFAKATNPERVFVGICWQVDKEHDKDCFVVDYKRGEQVRELFFDWREGEGVCWARSKSHALFNGETYFFQVDSHSRFAEGWDQGYINMLEGLYDPKAALTSPPSRYNVPNILEEDPKPNIQRVDPFNKQGSIRFTGVRLNKEPNEPLAGFFISAACFFSRSEVLQEVPYDPYLYFDQEEVGWALRLYTHGWNIYSPNKPLMYHLYAKNNDPTRNTHWDNLIKTKRNSFYQGIFIRGQKRFDHLTQYQISNNADHIKEIDKYALGTARSIESFEVKTGIDFKHKQVGEYGLRASFIPGLVNYLSGAKVYVPSLDGDKHPNKAQKEQAVDTEEKTQSSLEENEKTLRKAKYVICISANQGSALEPLLASIFQDEKTHKDVRVSIAWHAEYLMVLPEALKPYQPYIRSRHVLAPPHGNAIAEVFELWQEPEHIIVIDQYAELAQGWFQHFTAAYKKLPKGSFLTQSGLERKVFKKAVSVHITASLVSISDQIFIAAQAKPLTKKANTLISATPLASFDFIAGKRDLWRTITPDPHYPKLLGSVVFSARCFTHGIVIQQAHQPMVILREGGLNHQFENRSRIDPITRARHILAIEFSTNEMALVELDRYGHGDVVMVEGFWEKVGVNYNEQTISKAALAGSWSGSQKEKSSEELVSFADILTTENNDASTKSVKIFVQIASYRDTECQYTVQDLFTKATYPDRIFVGICWQSIPEEDDDCFRVVTRPDQVRVKHFNARDSKGACWARFHTQELWQGEEYTLQIDSHMRMEQGWDVLLLSMLQSLDSEKAVLTTYPPGYTPPHDLNPKTAHKLIAKEFNSDGIFIMGSQRIDPAVHHSPVLGAYISACLLFGPSSIIQDVPYDPYLYFFGEEISLSVRLWTQGYDIYHPHIHVAWHDWKRDNRKATHFQDHEASARLNAESFARVRYILNREVPDHPFLKEYVVKELDKYGLGKVRTLEEYESFSGVSFSTRSFQPFARDGVFTRQQSKSAKPLHPVAVQGPNAVIQQVQSQSLEPYMAPKKPLIMPKNQRLALAPEQQIRNHGAIKTYESNQVVVYDDFLPEHIFDELYQYTIESDYRHINTTGSVNRVWSIDNGFPLRSEWNAYYEAMNQRKHDPAHTYPCRKPTDRFIEHVNALTPEVQHIIGLPKMHWAHYSVSAWIYPPNTGLSLHNDGSGSYSGAYVYFLNKEWRIHWGGLLLVMDDVANQAMETHMQQFDGQKFYKEKWLHQSEHNDYAMEAGFARTIFPKRNRIVFIAPDAYHIVTKVLPNAGDNVRMSFAGFFARGVLNEQQP